MKLDITLVRCLFQIYEKRLQSYLASPRYCLYTGIRVMVTKALEELTSVAMSSFRIGAAEVKLLQQLHLWTECLEFGLAQSFDDCLTDADRNLLLLLPEFDSI